MEAPSLLLLSNQKALERAMDVIANNVANMSTPGFKREGLEFDTYVSRAGSGSATGNLSFIVDRATYRDPSGGPITPTNNPLDLAIQGKGYFAVQTPQGTRYTRAGSFQLDSQGQIVTQAGDPVLGEGNQPITVPDTAFELTVSADGNISARVDDGVTLLELGKLTVDNFDNEQDLKSTGGGLYATSDQPTISTDSQIVQGALEQSNVQPVQEITQMIDIMRSYEQTCNLMSQENTRLTNALNDLAKTTA